LSKMGHRGADADVRRDAGRRAGDDSLPHRGQEGTSGPSVIRGLILRGHRHAHPVADHLGAADGFICRSSKSEMVLLRVSLLSLANAMVLTHPGFSPNARL